MISLLPELANLSLVFAPLFSKSVWEAAQVLLTGAILAVGPRTVASTLSPGHGNPASMVRSRHCQNDVVDPGFVFHCYAVRTSHGGTGRTPGSRRGMVSKKHANLLRCAGRRAPSALDGL